LPFHSLVCPCNQSVARLVYTIVAGNICDGQGRTWMLEAVCPVMACVMILHCAGYVYDGDEYDEEYDFPDSIYNRWVLPGQHNALAAVPAHEARGLCQRCNSIEGCPV
jgi:hypothetical protein